MRRKTVLLAALLGLLAMAFPSPAAANTDHFRLKATVTGETNPPPGSEGISPTRRTSGPSAFQGLQINAVIDCRTIDDPNVEEVVVADLVASQEVTFTPDDDVSDGYGTVNAMDGLEDTAAVETRSDGVASPANVRVRVHGGTFHRLLGVVEVTLRLDVRVERDPDNIPGNGDEELQCHDSDHEVRIVFLLGPDADTDPTSGFALTGVARSHDPGDVQVVRTICRTVSSLTLPTLPEDNVPCAGG